MNTTKKFLNIVRSHFSSHLRKPTGRQMPVDALVSEVHSMIERPLLVAAVGCLVAFAISTPVYATSRAFVPTPNIVVIMTDDQDDLGSLDTMLYTQKLLVEEGVRLTNSFVQMSICLTSRASFHTGQSAHNHLVSGSYATFAPRENNSLGVWLQQAGYTTALMGKFMNGYGESDPTHIVPGWNEWDAAIEPMGYFDYSLNENGVVKTYGLTDEEYQTDVLTKKGVAFITKQARMSTPFFLLLSPIAPHGAPARPPSAIPAPRHAGSFGNLNFVMRPNFNEPSVSDKPGFVSALLSLDPDAIALSIYKFRKRRETLLAVDEMVRDIVGALQINRLMGKTYIIFTSDNGLMQGEHRLGGKLVLYEESIRVPFVIRGPSVSHNQVRTQLATNLDLTATILALAGATPGNAIDGRSLLPVIQFPAGKWRSAFGYQGWHTLNTPPRLNFDAIRSKNYIFGKLVSEQYGVEEEFYDLTTDPYEMTNRARDARCTTVVNFLRSALVNLSVCAGSSCWMTAEPPSSCQ